MRTFLIVSLALFTVASAANSARVQISDRALFEKVADVIDRYPQYSVFDAIEVGVDNRAVTLGGWVTVATKRDEILKRVQKVEGIRTLTNAIVVLPLSPRDDDLRHRVASAIYNNPMFWVQAQLPVPPIHIIVENGKITLTGVADSEAQRTTATMLAQRVGGNFGVTSRIVIPRSHN